MSNRQFKDLPGSSLLSGFVIAQGASAAISRKVNLAAVTDPGVNDDSGSGYGIGSLWANTTSNKVFLCGSASLGAAVWRDASGSGGIKETITIANSFSVGNAIYKTGGGYAKSKANSASTAEVLGVVEAASGTDFSIVYDGKINLPAHGFTVGAILFLSDGTAGLLTETEPTTNGSISKPVGTVLDANNVIIATMRGVALAPSTVGYRNNILTNANIGFVRGTDKVSQRLTGTLSGPVVLNLSRTDAVGGDEFDFGLVDVVTTGTNTLTIQENSTGSLIAFSDAVKLNGEIKCKYDGSAWLIFCQNVNGV